jgi:hypothetical protein
VYRGVASNDDDIHITTNPDGLKVASCNARDNTDHVSVVGFGNLPVRAGENGAKNYIAVACTWMVDGAYSIPSAAQSDIRMNKEDYRWGAAPFADACQSKYSVQGVLTHELGHTFGLAHVSEADHGNLTMSTLINGFCKEPEATFGEGDILGMRARY